MFEQVPPSSPDAILGLNEAFQTDNRPQRVNLTVGVFVDESGCTPILRCVKEAERRLVDSEQTKTYLNIAGNADYDRLVPELILGASHPLLHEQRVVCLQTPGGTGALRVVADFVAKHYPGSSVWVSQPTWANHPAIFAAAGIGVHTYAYFDEATGGVASEALLDALAQIPAGDFVVLHGCCHNPTGADPSADTWHRISEVIKTNASVPIVDLAYQGFGKGLEEDAAAVRLLSETLDELIVCSSFSKTFGLYRERTGAICIVARDSSTAQRTLDAVKICIRRNYSNPPSHGAAVVATILDDNTLRGDWLDELTSMSGSIRDTRNKFATALAQAGWPDDLEFLRRQTGMFSLIGLPPEAIDQLRESHGVYLVRNGRMNLAGINSANIDYVVAALMQVRSQLS